MCDQYFVCYVLNIQENGKYNFLSLLFHGRNVLFNLFQCYKNVIFQTKETNVKFVPDYWRKLV